MRLDEDLNAQQQHTLPRLHTHAHLPMLAVSQIPASPSHQSKSQLSIARRSRQYRTTCITVILNPPHLLTPSYVVCMAASITSQIMLPSTQMSPYLAGPAQSLFGIGPSTFMTSLSTAVHNLTVTSDGTSGQSDRSLIRYHRPMKNKPKQTPKHPNNTQTKQRNK